MVAGQLTLINAKASENEDFIPTQASEYLHWSQSHNLKANSLCDLETGDFCSWGSASFLELTYMTIWFCFIV